jgi:hypothetical protein
MVDPENGDAAGAMRITDPAPVTPDLKPRSNRGVRVHPFC